MDSQILEDIWSPLCQKCYWIFWHSYGVFEQELFEVSWLQEPLLPPRHVLLLFGLLRSLHTGTERRPVASGKAWTTFLHWPWKLLIYLVNRCLGDRALAGKLLTWYSWGSEWGKLRIIGHRWWLLIGRGGGKERALSGLLVLVPDLTPCTVISF